MVKRLVDTSIYGEFTRLLDEDPASLRAWLSNLFMALGKNKSYKREQVLTLAASFEVMLAKAYPGLDEAGTGEDIAQMTALREVETHFMRLLDRMEEALAEKSQYSKNVGLVKALIAREYGQPEMGVTHIARALHYIPAYLNVLFKQETGITVKQYLINYRLERSRQMLREGRYRIVEIAARCGFMSANYFAKVFKEATGLTPVEYKKK